MALPHLTQTLLTKLGDNSSEKGPTPFPLRYRFQVTHSTIGRLPIPSAISVTQPLSFLFSVFPFYNLSSQWSFLQHLLYG